MIYSFRGPFRTGLTYVHVYGRFLAVYDISKPANTCKYTKISKSGDFCADDDDNDNDKPITLPFAQVHGVKPLHNTDGSFEDDHICV